MGVSKNWLKLFDEFKVYVSSGKGLPSEGTKLWSWYSSIRGKYLSKTKSKDEVLVAKFNRLNDWCSNWYNLGYLLFNAGNMSYKDIYSYFVRLCKSDIGIAYLLAMDCDKLGDMANLVNLLIHSGKREEAYALLSKYWGTKDLGVIMAYFTYSGELRTLDFLKSNLYNTGEDIGKFYYAYKDLLENKVERGTFEYDVLVKHISGPGMFGTVPLRDLCITSNGLHKKLLDNKRYAYGYWAKSYLKSLVLTDTVGTLPVSKLLTILQSVKLILWSLDDAFSICKQIEGISLYDVSDREYLMVCNYSLEVYDASMYDLLRYIKPSCFT